MKKNIIVCGLIGGTFLAVFMLASVAACYRNEDFEGNMWLGYASMILAFSLIFVGVKNFRDKFNEGFVSFGQAFKMGLFISLIASSMYVIAWLIDYYVFIPDFMDKYGAHVIREATREGASATEIAQKVSDVNQMKDMYQSPLMVVLITYAEVLPVGLMISLISAFILKRKPETLL